MVLPQWSKDTPPTASEIAKLCDVRLGIGSDGILLGPLSSTIADFGLRIFNPDGSEAEKSGNGLRIFCRYLWDAELVQGGRFSVATKGGVVNAQVMEGGRVIRVSMGTVSFDSTKIPVSGTAREVLMESIKVGDKVLQFSAATIGNPHCVVVANEISEEFTRRYGPLLENAQIFPNRTNVQFMKVLDPRNIRIEIWERGAGYTYASGSSSCAAAAVALKLGLAERNVTVHMRGGSIEIEINSEFEVVMTGRVAKTCYGNISIEFDA